MAVLMKGQPLTLTASRMRMALAMSFSLRQALRAESRILASGTRSYPIRVFMPSDKNQREKAHESALIIRKEIYAGM